MYISTSKGPYEPLFCPLDSKLLQVSVSATLTSDPCIWQNDWYLVSVLHIRGRKKGVESITVSPGLPVGVNIQLSSTSVEQAGIEKLQITHLPTCLISCSFKGLVVPRWYMSPGDCLPHWLVSGTRMMPHIVQTCSHSCFKMDMSEELWLCAKVGNEKGSTY